MTESDIARQLGKTGLCVCPDFLSSKKLRETRGDFDEVEAAGGFHRAGVGHGSQHEVRDDVRHDKIHWLERNVENSVQTSLFDQFDLLQTAFNRTLFLGLTRFEGHYASYPQGGLYQRHRDSFGDTSASGSTRMVSVVLYLNEDWRPADGGRLRVYSHGGGHNSVGGETHTDVSPIGGTLVCFMSRESEHEVLQSFANRISIAGWFGRD